MAIQKGPTQESIRNMFDRLAPRYDLFNRLASMGLDGRWRAKTLENISSGMRVLDLGCGTGDLTLAALRKVGYEGEVVGIDFSEPMLQVARERYRKAGLNGSLRIRFEPKKAEELPIAGELFDCVVSGFVLRNIYQNIDAILEGVRRSLVPGGKIRFVDMTEPSNPVVRFFWKFYVGTCVAVYGKILFGKDYPIFYLTQSAERFFRAESFVHKLRDAGFRGARSRSFLFGVITLYQAERE
jgi:demethylmenaquinone methyltransferase/2-methoxy-6-polyprenyl-1,4-benzoquinol methylase